MASALDDIEAELRMLIHAYQDLKRRVQTHPLLDLIRLHPDAQGFDYTDQFWSTYRRGNEHDILVWNRYTKDLEKATHG